MMKFHILTLFPEMVQQGLATSILGRAAEKNLISIDAVNIRDYTQDKHGKVDDYTYGGGAGMLMQAQPVYDAYRSVAGEKKIRCVYLTPQGEPFTQKKAKELSGEEELVLLCGHYEGIDERVLEEVVTDYISIGDYVLTGGELAAMVVVDAVARLVSIIDRLCLHQHSGAAAISVIIYFSMLVLCVIPDIHRIDGDQVLLRRSS
jgi:tRNA (guanine37-N1)-methyltransferase